MSPDSAAFRLTRTAAGAGAFSARRPAGGDKSWHQHPGPLEHPDTPEKLAANLKKTWRHADWMAADVPAGQERHHALKAFPELSPIRRNLDVADLRGREARQHVYDLALFPAPVLEALGASALRDVAIGSAPMTGLDHNSDLKGVRPRGWAEGQTWDAVAGSYSHNTKTVTAGDGDHGSASLALHEAGHAVGDLLGYNHDPELAAHHGRLFPKLMKYLQQDGPGEAAGRQELLAEGIAVLLKKGREVAAAQFDEGFVKYLEGGPLSGKPLGGHGR